MNQTAVKLKAVSVLKNQKSLLGDVSFGIKPGVICGLLGPSGAGKTTLMRVIMGIQIPTNGQVKVLDKRPGSLNNRQKIGYVTQSPAVYQDLSVIQNLTYFRRLTSASSSDMANILDTVHLGAKRKQLVSSLSGGERARVSLAVALLGDPELLILDEPTVGLDPLLRLELWQLFTNLARAGKTLLVSSHVMSEAEHCQQLLLLRGGEVLWDDSPQELLRRTHQSSAEAAFIALMKEPKQ